MWVLHLTYRYEIFLYLPQPSISLHFFCYYFLNPPVLAAAPDISRIHYIKSSGRCLRILNVLYQYIYIYLSSGNTSFMVLLLLIFYLLWAILFIYSTFPLLLCFFINKNLLLLSFYTVFLSFSLKSPVLAAAPDMATLTPTSHPPGFS